MTSKALEAVEDNLHSIPKAVWRKAVRTGAAIIINDYYLARRQRVHFAVLPETEEHYAEHELTDVIQWLLEHGYDQAILVPGVRRRPQPYFRLDLRAMTAK